MDESRVEVNRPNLSQTQRSNVAYSPRQGIPPASSSAESNESVKAPVINRNKCSYCKRFGHNKDACEKLSYKNQQSKKESIPQLTCFGCGAPGVIRSNGAICKGNKPVVSTSSDFHSVSASVDCMDSRLRPVISIGIYGASGKVLVDTGAKHCVGSVSLRSLLIKNRHKLDTVYTELKYADGRACAQNVEVAHVRVTLRGITLGVDFIMLPNATESLLGMNFIQDIGMVLDFQRGIWFLRGDKTPQPIEYECKSLPPINCSSNMRTYDKHRRSSPSYKLGDLVLVEAHLVSNASKGFSRKFAPRREGPYRISQIASPSSFVVSDSQGHVKGKYHASALTPYVGISKAIVHQRRRGRPTKSQPGRPCDLEGEAIARSNIPAAPNVPIRPCPPRRSPRFRAPDGARASTPAVSQ
ncbi:unnamed protein product, partial [Brenthis ino]